MVQWYRAKTRICLRYWLESTRRPHYVKKPRKTQGMSGRITCFD